MARRILWCSLVIAPIAFAVHRAGGGEVLVFVLSAAALIPLAWLIGEATEHAAHHTGPGIGGFLNASFGNAPELIIALFAVAEGLPEVVRGSLSGSVIGNLLLVLGFSLLFGGKGELDRWSSLVSLSLVMTASLLLLIPAVPSWEGDPERHSLAVLSLPVSIVLLLLYVGVTWYSLRAPQGAAPHLGRAGAHGGLVAQAARWACSRSRRPSRLWSRRCSPRPSTPSPRRPASPTSSWRRSSSPSSATRPSTAAPSSWRRAARSSSRPRSRSPRAPRWRSSSSRRSSSSPGPSRRRCRSPSGRWRWGPSSARPRSSQYCSTTAARAGCVAPS